MQWNILNAKRHVFTVNGHSVEGTVTVQWTYEDTLPVAGDDFDFGDSKANQDYEARFGERGDLANVIISVIVRAEGLEGIDTLGGCHVAYKSFEADVMSLVNDHAMTDNATEACQKEILDAATRLVKYAKAA